MLVNTLRWEEEEEEEEEAQEESMPLPTFASRPKRKKLTSDMWNFFHHVHKYL